MTKSTPQERAREHGRSFEHRVAKLLDGYVYVGQDGDVVAGDWIAECKYSLDFRGLTKLRYWIAQAKSNADAWKRRGVPKHWVVIFTGGNRTGEYAVLPLEQYKEMKRIYEQTVSLR